MKDILQVESTTFSEIYLTSGSLSPPVTEIPPVVLPPPSVYLMVIANYFNPQSFQLVLHFNAPLVTTSKLYYSVVMGMNDGSTYTFNSNLDLPTGVTDSTIGVNQFVVSGKGISSHVLTVPNWYCTPNPAGGVFIANYSDTV
jgi:hypothetical protein